MRWGVKNHDRVRAGVFQITLFKLGVPDIIFSVKYLHLISPANSRGPECLPMRLDSFPRLFFVWQIAVFAVCTLIMGVSLSHAVEPVASTADHSKFDALKGPFETGPSVTKACLSCHTEAAKQIHTTKHWTWQFRNEETGQLLGKRNVVNNFCISTESNIGSCSTCHVGYGWTEREYDFTSEENVDCLVCHDTTATYSKKKVRFGGKRLDLAQVAQNVGPTSRATCGACHFKGGGGDAVKHGDLDPSMLVPDVFVDVHMDADGLNFTCATCHATDSHAISGSRYTPNAEGADSIVLKGIGKQDRASCQACHGDRPMHDEKLNDHTDKLACEVCHVPSFARGDFATKMWWDWSTAGKLDENGKPFEIHNELGQEIYNSKKGDFEWGSDVTPEYVWFNGTVNYTLVGDSIDPDAVVPINRFAGAADDPNSRIWPVKVMRGKQPYDSKNNSLAYIHTTGKDGFWTTFDWEKSIQMAMDAAGAPYSGEYGFVETSMMWPMAHMVAPAKDSLTCTDCHTQEGRLNSIEGVYLPGRDRWALMDFLGWGLAGLTLLGVLAHGLMRLVLSGKKEA
ncbi:MAG: tetrathionate reductase family octaheme c-type cytochrome [Magnetospiraceae bacterium]